MPLLTVVEKIAKIKRFIIILYLKKVMSKQTINNKPMKVLNIARVSLAALLAISLSLSTVFAQTAPADVENLKATTGDASVMLTWDAANGPAKITKYLVFQGTQSVTAQGGRYEKNYEVVGSTTYAVTGLTNGTKYYFAVVAFDEKGDHSENYSNEISATPLAPGTTDTAPKVSNASSLNNIEVAVAFSTQIQLPVSMPEKAFSIKENITDAKLEVLAAKVSAADSKVVIITTDKQTAGTEYIITAHSDITDTAKNPVKSGTSDTASFKGSPLDKSSVSPTPSATGIPSPSPEADIIAPVISEVSVIANNKINVIFSEAIVLKDTDSDKQFLIAEKENELSQIKVTKITLKEDKKTIELETEPQESNKEYVITVLDIKDLAGNTISQPSNANKASYISKEMQIKDILPPEDVTGFMANIIGDAVKLSWTASIDSAKDLVDQILYQSSNDGKTYIKVKNLGPAVTNYTIRNLKAGMNYTFKLTVKDTAGNESKGVITSITLPQTGAGLGISLLGTIIGLAAFHRKRKEKI